MRQNILSLTAVLAAAIVMSSIVMASSVANATTVDVQCWHGRKLARSQYERCFYRISDARKAERCLARYYEAWSMLQTLSGTPCDDVRLVDNLDGTVTDNWTGLTWEKKSSLDSVVNESDPHDADNSYTYSKEDADPTNEDGTVFTSFLAALNEGAGFAGSSGWRLPTLAEIYTLFTLVDGECRTPPCIDAIYGPYPTLDLSLYWSSSTILFQGNQLGGRGVAASLANPTTSGFTNSAKTGIFLARAVRGGLGPL